MKGSIETSVEWKLRNVDPKSMAYGREYPTSEDNARVLGKASPGVFLAFKRTVTVSATEWEEVE